MQGHKIYKKLAWLNVLPEDEAAYVFRECGGSPRWARLMAESRPFPMLDDLFDRAERLMTAEADIRSRKQIIERLGKLLER